MENGSKNGHTQKTCPSHVQYKAITNIPKVLEADFVYPDLPSKCTWDPNNNTQPSPHTKRSFKERPKVFGNILEAIGMTPMVRLNHVPQSLGIKCKMYAKCEFLNPGGSVKDRIGYRMLLDAEEEGLLIPGVSTIIEPTSGNTGIGLAMASAVRGYRCIIVLPEKNSDEKVNTLTALGAEIIRTRTEAKFNEPDSLVAVAQRLQKEIPNSVILNQYTNCGNPLAHYDGTGAEILYQLDNKVDMVVLGAGTGGTVTGVGRQIKEKCPDCKIVAVDPEGSILARPESLNESDVVVYDVEGIGYDFIPTVLDHNVVDKWVKSNDSMALPISRRLIREEGLLCGGSSGAAMSVALKVAQELREDQTCVVICPDNIRNYMTKFVVDQWMEARNFKESVNVHCHSWWDLKVSQMIAELKKDHQLTLPTSTTCRDVMQHLRGKSIDHIPIINEQGDLEGVATMTYLMNKLLDSSLNVSDSIERALFKKFVKINCESSVGRLSRILEKESFVVIACNSDSNGVTDNSQTQAVALQCFPIITQKDMFNFLAGASFENGHDRVNGSN